MSRFIMLTLSLLLIHGSAWAGSWYVGSAPPSSGARSAAVVVNDEGNKLHVLAKPGPGGIQVIAGFELGNGDRFGRVLPSYKIDNLPVVYMSSRSGKFVNDHLVLCRVYTSFNRVVGPRDPLYFWIRGLRISFKYVNQSGVEKVTYFSLKNSARSILAATGLKYVK